MRSSSSRAATSRAASRSCGFRRGSKRVLAQSDRLHGRLDAEVRCQIGQELLDRARWREYRLRQQAKDRVLHEAVFGDRELRAAGIGGELVDPAAAERQRVIGD